MLGFGFFSLEQDVFKVDGVSGFGIVRDTLHLLLPWSCPWVTRGDSATHRDGVFGFMGMIASIKAAQCRALAEGSAACSALGMAGPF